ncbi:hypothetical protein [Streptomyces gobiensis]|uniref:hypothetical protein n=1 Tax=Streptomyces gobiensis TaxID=2875706 RepID=UPI001E57F4BE|nr:hypothetical protein [Streptomyces gobiensis]UGY93154.1 hypothetical protein test1122_16495 [Streptomyces gobiensis]
MARSSAGAFVAGLTAVALGVVGVLAYQASAAQDRAAEATTKKKPSAPASSPAPGASGKPPKSATALPAGSGTGQRVVYALAAQRVWLVDDVNGKAKVIRTYKVTPSTVSPLPGTYTVTSRSAHITGSDGVPVENVVRFTQVGETVIGFSAALDGKKPKLDPAKQTGGIRESREDGEALWQFATINTKVVVVP